MLDNSVFALELFRLFNSVFALELFIFFKSVFALEIVVSLETVFALEPFASFESVFALELILTLESVFALELLVLIKSVVALKLYIWIESGAEYSTCLSTDVEHSTLSLLTIGIESAHPFLVHGDSGPPFRVGELELDVLEYGASILALTCVEDKSIESEGISSRRAARSALAILSRLCTKAKAPDTDCPTTGARSASDAGIVVYWVIGGLCGPM